MPSFTNSWGGVVLIIKSIQVKNFRSIKDETLYCDKLTALVGANGSGKSSFLHALELFQSKSPKVELDDYYNRNIQDDIVIRVTFSNLSQSATELFASYIQNDELVVERVFKWDGSKAISAYHGSLLQNPDFVETNNADNANDGKKRYEELKKNPAYSNFPELPSYTKIKEFLQDWETKNPDKCKRMPDDGQFFGWTEVGKGHLGRFIRFLYIPAVRDAASDASEGGRSSVLKDLMDIVIRNKLSEKPEIKEFQKDAKERYAKIMDPSNLPEIKDLAAEMTKTLQNFVPSAEINLSWGSMGEFKVDTPDAVAKLVEDGYQSTVNRTGHGLQRAFIMTILQHLSSAKTNTAEDDQEENQPVLVMIIEEPELYQHPNRQRHLAKVFLSLSERGISGVSSSMQIIYSTHSPHFVGIDRINQIRLLRKIPSGSEKPKITKIRSTTLDFVAKELEKAYSNGTQFTGNSLIPRLHAIMTPWMNEGFFSDVVVLVEGETDRSAILGVAASLGHDLESLGISVIPCYSKQNLDRPYIIFRNLGIPVFLMWDSGKGKENANENHQLLVLLGQKKEDWPNKVEKNFACFETNMDTVLKNEISETLFNSCMGECEQEFAMGQGKERKNPMVISKIIEKAREKGGTSPTIEKIVKNILELKKAQSATLTV